MFYNNEKIKNSMNLRTLFIIFFMILFVVIIISIFYVTNIEEVKEEQEPNSLDIIPDIITTTSPQLETTTTIEPETTTTETTISSFTIYATCETDNDCPGQTKCEQKIFYHRTGSCINGECSYGEWTTGTCTQSVSNCGAECDSKDDCLGGLCEQYCSCVPEW